MYKKEYDFLTWKSFPSSIKLTNDAATRGPWSLLFSNLPVTPSSTVKATMQVKELNALADKRGLGYPWGIMLYTSPTLSPKPTEGWVSLAGSYTPLGTHDWMPVSLEKLVPPNQKYLHAYLVGPAGTTESPMNAWFDDLKIYQDGVLIYSNDFSNWSPVIGAGVGAPIGGVAGYLLKEPLGPMVSEVVGAVLGGALGGGVGLLTGLGIIPVPQIPIPTFGATPEEPGAPARLGKYQITG